MSRVLLSLIAALLIFPACSDHQIMGDDDDSTGDDDDSAGDDDDSAGDDDDSAGDDDDSAGDDDDSTSDSTDVSIVLGESYCIDWDTANVTEPASFTVLLTLGGINLTDFPIMLGATSIDETSGSIEMLGAPAQASTCLQDLSQPTFELTTSGPGTWSNPDFLVGPGPMTIDLTGFATINFEETVVSGTFTADASQIIDGTLNGWMDVGVIPGACTLLNCQPCPSNPSASCAAFAAQDIVYNATGFGALQAIP